MTLDELEASGFVTGEGTGVRRGWPCDRRRILVKNLRYVVSSLWDVGFTGEIGADGSFAAATISCRDVDVYCVVEGPDELAYDRRIEQLNAVEGADVWNTTDEALLVYKPGIGLVTRLQEKYDVDLRFDFGDVCGIFGPDGTRQTYREAWRRRRVTGHPKGVILLHRN